MAVTLAILVPNDKGLLSHIIGKNGSFISEVLWYLFNN